MSIAENLQQIRRQIAEACLKAGRDQKEVMLLPVSKRKSLEAMEEAMAAGEHLFGENRIQEAREKRAALPESVKIDYIGHLQSNKAGLTPGQFRLLHSLDSVKLAGKLQKVNQAAGITQAVLIEVNCSGESSKGGFDSLEALKQAMTEILQFPNLDVQGFMTMAPWVQDETILRDCFRTCRQWRDSMEEQFGRAFPELSMGMTNDFNIAIEEGSTMIRIGTAIFGQRQ